jgi:hypothetical protein
VTLDKAKDKAKDKDKDKDYKGMCRRWSGDL